MGKAKTNIQAGQRFGRLTTLEPSDQRKNGYVLWRCRCDCGSELLVESRHLKRGTIHDCGCNSVKARRDLRGMRFGRLVVLSETDRRAQGGTVVWRCQCDCGRTAEVSSRQLLNGYTKSCGCLSRPPLKDWVGKQFGDLTVTAYGGKRDGSHYWRCRCKCGKELEARQSNLQNGHTQSCGCRYSIGDILHFVNGTCIEAIQSKTVSKNNTSGVRGVYRNKRTRKWVAQITFQHKTYYLGSYSKLEDAAKARRRGEERFDNFLEWYAAEYAQPADALTPVERTV